MKKRSHAIWVVAYKVFIYQHFYDKIQKIRYENIPTRKPTIEILSTLTIYLATSASYTFALFKNLKYVSHTNNRTLF